MLLRMVRCQEPKKNSLSFTMGPPTVPPNWLRLRASFWVPKKLGALSAPFGRNSKEGAWMAFVPDLVTILTTAPPEPPYLASKLLVSTENCESASGLGKPALRLLILSE